MSTLQETKEALKESLKKVPGTLGTVRLASIAVSCLHRIPNKNTVPNILNYYFI